MCWSRSGRCFSPAVADIVTDLVRYAERQIAQRLILIIDDALELAKEVFDLIAQMMTQLSETVSMSAFSAKACWHSDRR